jgi:hypothetical protein
MHRHVRLGAFLILTGCLYCARNATTQTSPAQTPSAQLYLLQQVSDAASGVRAVLAVL